MNVLVLHRFPRGESFTRGLAAALTMAGAVYLEDLLLGLLAMALTIGWGRGVRVAKAAQTLRPTLSAEERASTRLPAGRRDEVGRMAARQILDGVDVSGRPRLLATAMHELWMKALVRPPSPGATAALLLFYASVLGGLGSLLLAGL